MQNRTMYSATGNRGFFLVVIPVKIGNPKTKKRGQVVRGFQMIYPNVSDNY